VIHISDRLPPIHHPSNVPVEPSGFVHYKRGCLCHRCEHYFGCRVRADVVAEREDPVSKAPTWLPKSSGLTKAMREVIDVLFRTPEGMTARQLAAVTRHSTRHIYRVVRALDTMGYLKKVWQIQRELVFKTDGKTCVPVEVAHRYVLVNRPDKVK